MSIQIKKSRNISNVNSKKFQSQPTHQTKSTFSPCVDKFQLSVNSIRNLSHEKPSNHHDNARFFTEVNKARRQNENLTYVVLLPYFLDENFLPIKQPFLFQFDATILTESEFSMSDPPYFETQRNNFIVKFCGQQSYAQIIAIGKSIQDVKNCLKKNMKLNPLWSNIKKVVGKLNETTSLLHSPLDAEDVPIHCTIGKKKFQNLITETKSYDTSTRIVSESKISTCDNQYEPQESLKNSSAKSQPRINIEEKKLTKSTMIEERKDSQREFDKKNNTKDHMLITNECLGKQIQDLQRRTAVLSDTDILASTLKATIETVCSLFSHMNKEKVQSLTSYKVEVEDGTYKVQKKDKIFLEGLVELNLSKYQIAIGRAKPRNPCAFAYQLVSIAFPPSYCDNVWLGKKYYDEKEIATFFEQLKNKDAKFPLLFIWSFKDPFSEPVKGDFDIFLGQKRVRAFTDHIFRKSGIFEYDEEFESKVRTRLSKVLCSKNRRNASEVTKNMVSEEKNQESAEEESNGSSFVKKRKCGNSDDLDLEDLEDLQTTDGWDTKCFDW